MMMRILFVCSGNMYRSAGAESILRKKLADAGIDDWIVDSAGTLQLNQARCPVEFGKILAKASGPVHIGFCKIPV